VSQLAIMGLVKLLADVDLQLTESRTESVVKLTVHILSAQVQDV